MLEPIPDLVQLNVELLSDPAVIQGHPLVRLLAERDPKLGFLCPLALVQLDNGDCDAAAAEAALATCWLVDDSAINRPEDWEAGDNLEADETVEHQINADFQGKTIPLTFHSEADLFYCSEEFKAHIIAATAADLFAEQGDLAFLSTPEALIVRLTEQAGDPVALPKGKRNRYARFAISSAGLAGLRSPDRCS